MTKPARPQKVTSACLFVGASSALLLFYVIGWLTSWNSQEIQGGLRDTLTGAGVLSVGLTVQGTIDALRVVLLVSVVLLVAGAVFAVYAARGHLQSRFMLTGIAALTAFAFVITGGVVGLFPAAFAVAAIVRLWSRESRVWFAVVNGREVPAALVQAAAPPVPIPSVPIPPVPVSSVPVSSGPAAAPTVPLEPAPAGPPSSIRTLTLITSISAGLVSVVSAGYVATYLVAREPLTRAQLESPVRSMMDSTDAEIIDAMRVAAVVCGITVVLGLAALGATYLIWKRRGFGHFALTVLSGVTILMGLFTLVGLPWSAAAVWVVVLLRRRESRAWAGLS